MEHFNKIHISTTTKKQSESPHVQLNWRTIYNDLKMVKTINSNIVFLTDHPHIRLGHPLSWAHSKGPGN